MHFNGVPLFDHKNSPGKVNIGVIQDFVYRAAREEVDNCCDLMKSVSEKECLIFLY